MTEQLQQVPFGTDDFADNPEHRCPSLLLLDISGSMKGPKLDQLKAGLDVYKNELLADEIASKRVEIGIITFGANVEAGDFVTVDAFNLPNFEADGATPMGKAIVDGIELLRARKNTYRANGVSFYRPWIFLITDGVPTDDWQLAAELVQKGEKNKEFSFFAVGVQDADMAVLKQISHRVPLSLKGLQFKEMFQWLSNSQSKVSRSTPGDEVHPQDPTAPNGWATV